MILIKKEVLTIIYDKMQLLHEKIRKQRHSLQQQLGNMPEGTLCCAKNGNKFKWYLTNKNGKEYLPKKELNLAEKLAEKKYVSLLLKELSEEETALQAYLKSPHKFRGKAQELIENSTEYQNLLSSKYLPKSKELEEWMNEPYTNNTFHPEDLKIKTMSGKYVRSKSESIIDMMLYMNCIPYRYEDTLVANGTILHPDFTIRHPKTGEYYYWEHFGMMDNREYAQNVVSKLQLYISQGIIPNIQLITTYETRDKPLDSSVVEKIVRHYFLEN